MDHGRAWEADRTIVRFPDPAIEIVDERFGPLVVGHEVVERLWTGGRWLEGPVWFGDGRFLLFSDIPNDRMLRWSEATGEVDVFRRPSGNSNGNTRDRQGRLVTCEHLGRRVTRTEHDGTVTVLMDSYEGKRLNAPNDVITHSDGSVWFSDPGWGIAFHYEGDKADEEIPRYVFRIDPATVLLPAGVPPALAENPGPAGAELLPAGVPPALAENPGPAGAELLPAGVPPALAENPGAGRPVIAGMERPNGLCFSPDESLLYVVDVGHIRVFDMRDGEPVNGRVFVEMSPGGPDGIRTDADGNVWASAGDGGPGFDGVHCFHPDGTLLGRIHLPETCANLCFGGVKKNRLFMTASRSLYSVYVEALGAQRP